MLTTQDAIDYLIDNNSDLVPSNQVDGWYFPSEGSHVATSDIDANPVAFLNWALGL